MGRRFAIHSYRQSGNLGDAIQSVALARLLPGEVRSLWRDSPYPDNTGSYTDPGPHPNPETYVANGWMESPGLFPAQWPDVAAGVYFGKGLGRWTEALSHAAKRGAIAARCPASARQLASLGYADAPIIGCVTLTLPAYKGPRSGALLIDAPDDESWGGDRLTQQIPVGLSWADQWALACHRLDQIRRAGLVVTSRLHVALPALAMGTPVVIRRSVVKYQPDRLSILDWLGIRGDGMYQRDNWDSLAGDAYLAWLAKAIGVPGGRVSELSDLSIEDMARKAP